MRRIPTENDIRALAQERFDACVSIYMPAHPVTPEAQQDPIRLKNLLRGTKERLVQNKFAENEADDFLEPGLELLSDQDFWDNQSHGLAVFIGGGRCRHYRVPSKFDELVVVCGRFHLKPLLPLATRHEEFYVLALSGNHPRLLRGTRFALEEVKLKEMPESMAAALKYDDPEKQVQAHTGAPSAGGKRAAMYHGQGSGKDDQKDRLLRYFREVDRAVAPVIQKRPAPVVIAAVEYNAPIYREAHTHGHLFEKVAAGNPEHLDEQQLHERAWQIIEPHFSKQQQEVVEKMKASGNNVSNRLADILPAAHEGRIAELIVTVGKQRWGRWDEKKHRARLHPEERPGDEDLLDHAALETFLKGGEVHCVPSGVLPEGDSVAAAFRS